MNELDQFDWNRGQGEHHSFTGPTVDHTTNTEEGYYAYIDPKYPQKQGTNISNNIFSIYISNRFQI